MIRPTKFGPDVWRENQLVSNKQTTVRFVVGSPKASRTTDASAGFGGDKKSNTTFIYGDNIQRLNNTTSTNIIDTPRKYYPEQLYFGTEDKLQYILGPGSNPIKIGAFK